MTVAIQAEGLSKRYGSALALDGLDLEVQAGEVFGYLGPNGAGKSTTIALLLGLIRASSGRAEIFGLDVRRDVEQLHRRIGYVPGAADLWPSLTAAEVLEFLGNVHGTVDVAYRDELVERFELETHKRIRALSHGNRQKVLLVAAFAGRPDLVLLDEPTTGLDPLMARVFQTCVREASERGQTVFLSSHILSEVDAVCDRVGMLRAGRLIEVGELQELRALASLRVEVECVGPVPDVSSVPGVSQAAVDAGTLRCAVRGPIGPLLQALSVAEVTRLTTHEPSLEELFVAHYGGGVTEGASGDGEGGKGEGAS